jgi:NAD(P)-dependent dehydrogenase (short-subunit alcohol dehydrogenase family)
MSDLFGKTALVTGASRGMGAAVATKLAKQGVAFIGIHYANNRDAAEEVLAKVKSIGSDGIIIQADLKEGKKAADKIALEFKNRLPITFLDTMSRLFFSFQKPI